MATTLILYFSEQMPLVSEPSGHITLNTAALIISYMTWY